MIGIRQVVSGVVLGVSPHIWDPLTHCTFDLLSQQYSNSPKSRFKLICTEVILDIFTQFHMLCKVYLVLESLESHGEGRSWTCKYNLIVNACRLGCFEQKQSCGDKPCVWTSSINNTQADSFQRWHCLIFFSLTCQYAKASHTAQSDFKKNSYHHELLWNVPLSDWLFNKQKIGTCML